MIRITRRLALVALLLLAPLSAYAQTAISVVEVTQVTSSGGDISLLRRGDILTVDLVLSNDGTGIAGIGVDARGYDPDANGVADNGLSFLPDSSLAGAVVLADGSIPGQGSFGGLDNIRAPVGTFPTATGVVEGGNPFIPAQCNPTICTPVDIDPVELHARYIEAVTAAAPATGTGDNDLGIAGDLISNGDVHARLVFVATTGALATPTAMTLVFGSSAEFGNDVIDGEGQSLPFVGDSISFTLAPEPGTAMLFGIGLAGLASIRRR